MKNSTLIIVIVTFTALGAGGFAAAQMREPTLGRIPNDAITADGSLDLDQVPDYVVAYARDGEVAGYVAKSELFDPNHERVVVVDEALEHVVGHMVPNRGFVPIGTSDDEIPVFEGIDSSLASPPEN